MITDSATAAFSALAQRIYAPGSSAQVYQAIVDTAVDVVIGCDHSCIMLLAGGKFSTAASSDAVAAAIDEYERALGEGPCLDAILEERPQVGPRPHVRLTMATAGRAGYGLDAGTRHDRLPAARRRTQGRGAQPLL